MLTVQVCRRDGYSGTHRTETFESTKHILATMNAEGRRFTFATADYTHRVWVFEDDSGQFGAVTVSIPISAK